MTRRATPRPTFSGPTAIPRGQVTLHLWGDAVSGRVADEVFVSSERLHQLVFALPPGGEFRHSDDNRTIFAADELLYVLTGSLVLANPQTGEVHRAHAGEAVFFRRDTWHHGFNHGSERLRVIEYFAPPPATGASSAYARRQPPLQTTRYSRQDHLGRWPMQAESIRAQMTMRVVRESDELLVMDADGATITGLLVATEHLTVGRTIVPCGRQSAVEAHGGDEGIYVLDGVLGVLIASAAADEQAWFELHPGDGFYVPAGVEHQYVNMGDRAAQFLFGVAPDYRSPPATGG